MPDRISELRAKINFLSDKKIAQSLQRYFKTDKGEYGEGDNFIGLKVPVQRKLAGEFRDLSFAEIKILIGSAVHEERLISLFVLIDQYKKADKKTKEYIFSFYIRNRKGINNWDLVDISAPKIIGKHLFEKDKSILYKFALSKNVWERRIAILSTHEFIKNNYFTPTLKIAEILISDEHDLIQKAVGWMLREIGKKDLAAEEKFLKNYYKKMPRTMLRYAIEKFPEIKRKKYLQGKI